MYGAPRKKRMNLPDTPGQNMSGKNAARVVAMDAVTGQNMRWDAIT